MTPLPLKFRLLSLTMAAFFVFSVTACQTTRIDTPDTAAVEIEEDDWSPEANPIPVPRVVFSGQERTDNFEDRFEIPLTTVSEERKGAIDVPFEYLPLDRGASAEGIRQGEHIFPLNNRTGNLMFYREVGIPQLRIERLDDEHVRVWARVLNRTDRDIYVRVSLMGREATSMDDRYDYDAIIFRENVYRDFSFVMTGDESRRFTLYVTPAER